MLSAALTTLENGARRGPFAVVSDPLRQGRATLRGFLLAPDDTRLRFREAKQVLRVERCSISVLRPCSRSRRWF